VAGEGGEPSNNEVKLARYELLKSFVPALYILALAIPLWVAQPIASDLAGKTTDVKLTLSITIVASLGLGAGYLAMFRKTRIQAEELRRQRRRITTLEAELEEKGP
jgi:uncharacterized protein HemX